MPGEFYIEGKKEKVAISVILTKIEQEILPEIGQLLKLRRSSQSGDKVMTNTYAAVYEQEAEAAYIFAGAKIDLTSMEAGDTINIRVRTRVKEGGNYVVHDEKPFVGVQPASKKVIRITATPDNYGLEIAMRQTAGALKVISCEFFDARGGD